MGFRGADDFPFVGMDTILAHQETIWRKPGIFFGRYFRPNDGCMRGNFTSDVVKQRGLHIAH
jgi:hypothetical protein